jgi:hypothetical protein
MLHVLGVTAHARGNNVELHSRAVTKLQNFTRRLLFYVSMWCKNQRFAIVNQPNILNNFRILQKIDG